MTEELIQRDERGLFAKGNTIGQGRPKNVFQDYTPRAAYFLQTLTRSQILGIVNDPKKLDEYSSFDTIVLEHIANCFALDKNPLKQSFASAERERLMDRTTGKPKQALTGGDEDDKPLFPSDVKVNLVRGTER